jgi:hypothetical protein
MNPSTQGVDMTKSKAAQILGALGGRAGRGKSKARTREQASAAGKASALKRWGFKQPETANNQ